MDLKKDSWVVGFGGLGLVVVVLCLGASREEERGLSEERADFAELEAGSVVLIVVEDDSAENDFTDVEFVDVVLAVGSATDVMIDEEEDAFADSEGTEDGLGFACSSST